MIIIGELVKETNLKGGIPILISMMEKLLMLQIICLVLTNYFGIPKIFQNKPGIFVLHIEVRKDGIDMFKVKPRINWISCYEINLVDFAGFVSHDIIKKAIVLLDILIILRIEFQKFNQK